MRGEWHHVAGEWYRYLLWSTVYWPAVCPLNPLAKKTSGKIWQWDFPPWCHLQNLQICTSSLLFVCQNQCKLLCCCKRPGGQLLKHFMCYMSQTHNSHQDSSWLTSVIPIIMFDPYMRNKKGFAEGNGSMVITSLPTLDSLVNHVWTFVRQNGLETAIRIQWTVCLWLIAYLSCYLLFYPTKIMANCRIVAASQGWSMEHHLNKTATSFKKTVHHTYIPYISQIHSKI